MNLRGKVFTCYAEPGQKYHYMVRRKRLTKSFLVKLT